MDAPFYVGQEVVAVIRLEFEGKIFLEKGNDYTIEEMQQCNCGKWCVRVGVSLLGYIKMTRCLTCRRCDEEMSNAFFYHAFFEPKITISNFTFEDAINMVSQNKKSKSPVYYWNNLLKGFWK